MSWRVVQGPIGCAFCPTQITPGRWARFSDRGHGAVWCPECARRNLGEDPPAPTPALTPADPPPRSPGPAQASLFDVERDGPKLPSADVRLALETVRRKIAQPRDPAETDAPWTRLAEIGGRR